MFLQEEPCQHLQQSLGEKMTLAGWGQCSAEAETSEFQPCPRHLQILGELSWEQRATNRGASKPALELVMKLW